MKCRWPRVSKIPGDDAPTVPDSTASTSSSSVWEVVGRPPVGVGVGVATTALRMTTSCVVDVVCPLVAVATARTVWSPSARAVVSIGPVFHDP